jgi:hypothetical protein
VGKIVRAVLQSPGEITSAGAIFRCGRSSIYVRLSSLGLSSRFLPEIVGQQPDERTFFQLLSLTLNGLPTDAGLRI